jgi:hypothetical protein
LISLKKLVKKDHEQVLRIIWNEILIEILDTLIKFLDIASRILDIAFKHLDIDPEILDIIIEILDTDHGIFDTNMTKTPVSLSFVTRFLMIITA